MPSKEEIFLTPREAEKLKASDILKDDDSPGDSDVKVIGEKAAAENQPTTYANEGRGPDPPSDVDSEDEVLMNMFCEYKINQVTPRSKQNTCYLYTHDGLHD